MHAETHEALKYLYGQTTIMMGETMRTLLIAEAIPLKEGKMEGVVLGEFIRMFKPCFEDDFYFECKSDFLDYVDKYVTNVKRNKEYDRYKFVHFSGHGRYYKRKGAIFSFPKGDLRFDELPSGCFRNMVVTFSACELGNKDAMKCFAERTKAKCVIAPINSPRFEDAALFFVNFYYNIICRKEEPLVAFYNVKNMLNINADFRSYLTH
jgi:hypothetical protein